MDTLVLTTLSLYPNLVQSWGSNHIRPESLQLLADLPSSYMEPMARAQPEPRRNQSETQACWKLFLVLSIHRQVQLPSPTSPVLSIFFLIFMSCGIFLSRQLSTLQYRPHVPDLLQFAVSFCKLSPFLFTLCFPLSLRAVSTAPLSTQHGTSRDKLYQQIGRRMDNNYKIVLWLQSSINSICHSCITEMDFIWGEGESINCLTTSLVNSEITIISWT